MIGYAQFFLNFIEGHNTRFMVPVYQRNYEWKLEQCRQLYDDLIKVTRQNKKNHFFGSIVSTQKADGKMSEYLIIDGQQRITTVSLLLLAVYKLLEQSKIKSSETSLMQKIYEEYLTDKYQPAENKIKLKRVKDDLQAYELLFDDKSEPLTGSNLTINFRYFYDRIQKREISIDELFDSISKLQIINIFLGQEDNPQLIFESLNSTGMDLSEGDKIRNFVLMSLPPEIQETYYDKYWRKIEENTNFDVSSFVRDFLSIKNQTTPNMNNVYPTFKTYTSQFEDAKAGTEQVLTELLHYSKIYMELLNPSRCSLTLQRSINRLNHFEATVTRPYLMEVLNIAEQQPEKLPEKDVEKIFILVESYLLRRQVTEISSNALNKIFVTLHRDVLRLEGSFENYFDKLNYVLLQKTESGVFPDDIEFINSLSVKRVYQMRPKSKQYILERFENKDSKEHKDIWGKIEKRIYSIEHIMPQTLSTDWREMLGEDYDLIHKDWVDRLANLTLTAYNPDYSNYSFEYKKTMKHGFADSGIAMNQFIAKFDKWTVESLKERNDMLMKLALELWPMAKTSYKPSQQPLDILSLADGYNFTGQKITKFSFEGAEQNSDSWVDMMGKVISQIYSKNPIPLNQAVLNQSKQDSISGHFVSIPTNDKYYLKISDSMYVYIQNDTQAKINILRSVFGLYQIDENDLIFFLRSVDAPPDPEGTNRKDKRLAFWSVAIPILQLKTKRFTNHHPARTNWLDVRTGLKGIYITVVGNLQNLRVDLCISTPSKEENDRIYQFLKIKEQQIQENFPYRIVWLNKPEYKSSYLSISNSEFGISNTNNWDQCIDFFVSGFKAVEEGLLPHVRDCVERKD